jgi:hypothetical protein
MKAAEVSLQKSDDSFESDKSGVFNINPESQQFSKKCYSYSHLFLMSIHWILFQEE